jgi:dienelactone hydrolase
MAPARQRLRAALLAIALLVAAGIAHLRADQRRAFREVAGELAAARELERAEIAGAIARRLELVNHRGEAVAEIWVRRPARLSGRHRVLLTYAGRKTGRAILELVPARPDLVLVAVQYPEIPSTTLGERLRWPAAVRRAATRTVAGGLLAVSWLERDERLDPERLVVLGSSVGSAFAVAHAAIDERVPTLLVVHGGGDLPLVVRELEAKRGRPWRGRLYAAATWLLAGSFEPLRYVAEVAPRETIVVGARSDATFPTASTQALFDRAREPKRLIWTEGAHVRSKPGVEVDLVVAELERLLGPPPP